MFLPTFADALHNSSNSPGNATSTTAYGPIYNPAAPPPSTENYLGGGLGDHESQHALRLAGSGKPTNATQSYREFIMGLIIDQSEFTPNEGSLRSTYGCSGNVFHTKSEHSQLIGEVPKYHTKYVMQT